MSLIQDLKVIASAMYLYGLGAVQRTVMTVSNFQSSQLIPTRKACPNLSLFRSEQCQKSWLSTI